LLHNVATWNTTVRTFLTAWTSEDAIRHLKGAEIEMLALCNCILYKDRRNPNAILDYRNAFDPD
jgi:hypothetical protein